MHQDRYFFTRKEGLRIANDLRARGIDPALPVLNEMLPNINKMSQVPLGLCQIPLNMIEGTVTSGRTFAFTRDFYPLLDIGTEFANKWTFLYNDVVKEGLREPVKAMEYYNH